MAARLCQVDSCCLLTRAKNKPRQRVLQQSGRFVPSLQDGAKLQSGEPAGLGALPGDSSAHHDGMLTSLTGHLPSCQHSWSSCSAMEHGFAEGAALSELPGAHS